ncbi:MAG: hypothetical protein MZV64_64255 [Ignavibacteriales bacterium]|nr:hypothetical protein [Ignavibacteriales bacterium]
MNACTMFAWWGFNLWLPGLLVDAGRTRAGSAWPGGRCPLWSSSCRSACGSDTSPSASSATASGGKGSYVDSSCAAAVFMLLYSPDAPAAAPVRPGPLRRFLRDGLLHRFRRLDGGDLPHGRPGHGPGHHLQHRPHRQRRRAASSSAPWPRARGFWFFVHPDRGGLSWRRRRSGWAFPRRKGKALE